MGIGKDGFYHAGDIAKIKAQYNIILSGRNAGKSYAIACDNTKDYIGYLIKAWKTKKTVLGYIRRWDADVKASLVQDDFSDKIDFLKKLTKGKYDNFVCYRNKLYFAKVSEDGTIKKAPFAFGQVFALSLAGRYKSRQYPDIEYILFEESVATRDERYLANECDILQDMVSTILRSRNGVVFLLGNTVSRRSPYYLEWGLTNVPKMEVGQIDTYTVDDTLIAVELSANRDSKESKMFFGKAKKSIRGSEWQTESYLHLPTGTYVSDYSIIGRITFDCNLFKFTILLLMDEKANKFLYVYPAKRMSDYIISNKQTLDPTYHKALNPRIPSHQYMAEAWNDGKVCYSSNLCGQDFVDCLKNEKLNFFRSI